MGVMVPAAQPPIKMPRPDAYEQTALAEQRKGWVLDVLNRYQLGFDRGVREALDFELLNA